MKRNDLTAFILLAFFLAVCVAMFVLAFSTLKEDAESKKDPDRDQVMAYAGPQDTVGIRQMLVAYDIQHPDIVMRQLCFESGWLDCTDCSWECCNNPFGFIWKGKYKSFDNLEHAVEYYAWWQKQLYRGGDYYVFLDKIGYATAPNYINDLKKMW